MSSDEDIDLTPNFIKERAKTVVENILPPNSKERYVKAYDEFMKWRSEKKVKSLSESVFISNFDELSKTLQPSSLWCFYSMLKSTMMTKHDVNLKDFSKLTAFLKRQSDGFKSKKSKVFTAEEVQKFLNEAPDEIYLAIKLNGQRPRVDRFIAPREQFPELCRKMRWGAREKSANDVWYIKYLKQKTYANYLDEAFGLESMKSGQSPVGEEECVQLWPCVPRKRPYLSSADSILDLPTYSSAAFPELLDWSNDNILVAALGSHYHKWSWRSQSLISQGVTDFEIHCCKFDPQGKLLLVGTDVKRVEVHDDAQSKCIARNICLCSGRVNEYCSITAIDWSPTGNSFVTGCSHGTLSTFTRSASPISYRQATENAILIVRVSPDARYVTAAAVNDDAVLVFTWPGLQLFSSLKSDWTIKALTWHPWRSALLGIGAVTTNLNARVALWDAPTGKVRKRTFGRYNYSLDVMLFSKRTGELVLSLWSTDWESPKTCSQLVVMSDADTVVDQWGEGRSSLDRVRTMVFSPDGTKLATATADEDLIIWNFLPEEKILRKMSCKRFSAIPVFLDKVTNGVSYR